jgi:hypothetical protein
MSSIGYTDKKLFFIEETFLQHELIFGRFQDEER